jgi:hypothetical protein
MIGNTLIFFLATVPALPRHYNVLYECLLVICCSLSKQSLEQIVLWFYYAFGLLPKLLMDCLNINLP